MPPFQAGFHATVITTLRHETLVLAAAASHIEAYTDYVTSHGYAYVAAADATYCRHYAETLI